uniref:J domain-containing protein n=1 Tax=Oryza barthii TaxID=65489 RepID=A0A0D3HSZ9_9ORYZ
MSQIGSASEGSNSMAAAASPRLLLLVLLVLLVPVSNAIYCDEDDCYDLLGVKQDANVSEIKKAYYKLSLKHHPDKNPDPESRKLFVKIANAYEILKDESTRGQYDYAIAHPEEVFYNTAQYYRAYYGHKTDPRAVLIGLLLIISVFQYLNQFGRLKALEFERTGGISSKKKGHKQMDKKVEEVLSNEVELQIQGVEKPSVWRLYGVQFILLPYSIGKVLSWKFCWFWRYRIKKLPYAWEDACYLTRTSLKIPANTWQNIDDYRKENLVMKRLWEKNNMERYIAEMRKESKRRR